MSPTLLAAAGIVIASCAGFLIVGAANKWDVTARNYSVWMRVVGVVAVLGLTAVGAWARLAQPLVSAAIVIGGIALAVAYLTLHRRLTVRVRETLGASRSTLEPSRSTPQADGSPPETHDPEAERGSSGRGDRRAR